MPLRSLWPTLHCRRVAGVNPLLSIGWWCLSSVSPKRHCCRVSAADEGCRVYPLDPRPDAVALYSGCTPGLAKSISIQTQDNSHTELAFAKLRALAYTLNNVVGIIFRLATITPFVATNRPLFAFAITYPS
ncbi:uncharacterized protein TNCV_4075791 [Trichonephila clavipes]|nr:uncharacterized protein TNCV_4075791 [Trichonephila clavipes]